MLRSSVCALIAAVLLTGCTEPLSSTQSAPSSTAPLKHRAATDPVPNDPDDPAIWIHPTDPSRSLVLATDKIESVGGLYVFGLDGRLRTPITPLDRPNNVDVEHGFGLGDRRIDIAVVTERMKRRLRLFEINDGAVSDLAPEGLPILDDPATAAGEPMGVSLYRRPADGAVFVIVAPKTGGTTDYLWQYRLIGTGGRLSLELVRRFGGFSRTGAAPGEIGEIEAVVVDDEAGHVYYSDERYAIRKYHADPSAAHAAHELAAIGRDGYDGDREGLAIVRTKDRGNWLVSSDQVPGATRLHVYALEDLRRVGIITTGADSTDGLDATAVRLPGFSGGLLVMMNSGPRNFLMYSLDDLLARIAKRPG